MCFSAQASFTASAVLAIIGTLNLPQVTAKRQWLLAAIPFFFTIQQATEGVLWMTLGVEGANPTLRDLALYIYLFFAIFFWPICIPLSIYLAETVSWRKNVIGIFVLGGIATTLVNIYYAWGQTPQVAVTDHSINYIGWLPDQRFTYGAVVVLPTFFSSLKNMWQFGVLTALGAVITNYFFLVTYVSVWCFFCALISLLLYKIFRDNLPENNRVTKDTAS